jgi:hypothetical protein
VTEPLGLNLGVHTGLGTTTLASALRSSRQSYASPAAEPDVDGSTTVCIAPDQPEESPAATGYRPSPAGAGPRSCAPLEPFFDKRWWIREIEAVG